MRTNDLFIVEGHAVREPRHKANGRVATETARTRIEIDVSTGMIARVVPLDAPENAEAGAASPREPTPSAASPAGLRAAHRAPDLVLGDDAIIFPGLIDAHVHAREDITARDNYKEDFASAGEAAVRGGVTAFVEMPNNPEPPRDDASYRAKRELVRKSKADVLLYAIVGPGTEPLSFPAPYKVYMAQSIGDFCFADEESLRAVLPRYRDQWVAFHAEDPEILRRSAGAADHGSRRPPEAEVQAIRVALALCEELHVHPHICHLSTAGGLDAIREARARGLSVTTEVTPHHLFWDVENAKRFAHPSWLQCNPPIRTRADRLALLEALKDGEIDFLASDHAPHRIDEKEKGISGVTHLDTFGAFCFWLFDQGLTLEDLRRVACENPGRFLGRYLPHRYGRLEAGYAGSLTILERKPVTIQRSDLATRAGWSPFEGETFAGRVLHTIVRGELAYSRR